MTPVLPSARITEIYLVDSWVDISRYVVSDIVGSFGFASDAPDDRVAGNNYLSLTLNNVGKQFSPFGAETLTGWRKGVPIRVSVVYRSIQYVIWSGRIWDIEMDSGPHGPRRVRINAQDWLSTFGMSPLPPLTTGIDQRANEGIAEVLAVMPVQPYATDFDAGIDVFPTTHDAISGRSPAVRELNNLVMSEYGYLYLRRDRISAETLRFENRNARDARSTPATIPVPADESSHLVTEDGDFIITEAGDFIVLDETEAVGFDNSATGMTVKYGEKIYNDVTFICHPRRVDGDIAVLAATRERVYLAAGESTTIRLGYVDPVAGGSTISATGLLTPVSGTDYEMTANRDGTGADYTADLTVTPDYGGNYVEYALENTGGNDGYVYVQARGYGIYFYDPISIRVHDDESIIANGLGEIMIDQRYQPYADVSGPLASIVLNRYSEPVSVPNMVTMIANKDARRLYMFLYLDTGDLVPVKDDQTNVDGNYFIHGGNFRITPGGIITVSYHLKDALTLSDAYWLLETVGASELGETTIIGV